MQVGEIIKQVRSAQGLSQRALARSSGLSPQYISDIEKGRAKPSLNSLEKMAAALQIPVAHLLRSKDTTTEEVVEVPLLGRVPAGGPVMAEENILGTIPFPARFVRGTMFCLEVKGQSMIDVGIEDGDFILVRVQPTCENGQTVIARVNGEVTCKRFYRCNGKIRLEPANRTYRPIEAEDVEILGIVTYVLKKM
ncbi:MAG: repressor LexA [Peptococcaceae bacterium]|nr:repressor LexA [Peptococcaceae bacterium]